DLSSVDDDAPVTVAGLVVGVRRTLTKNGQQILIAQLEDTSGVCEVVVFAKIYEHVQSLFRADAVLLVKGRLRLRERRGAAPGEEPPLEISVSANEVMEFVLPARSAVPPPLPPSGGWHVEVSAREQIDRLAALIDEWPGDVPVVMHARGRSQRVGKCIAGDYRVRAELERIFGPAAVREGAEDASELR
ncbi:MAG: OB-fold nucleic acid binding domain-containing protein, partial [Candidatus Tumulicola sp.]